jgi:NAD-dependent dihydropyrimidine dehydrogenase PreA subunit
MLREVVKIDEVLCSGCGECVPACHEGAIQIIDGKARLVSDLMCDGLGACLGHCPQGAITIEKREAAPYDETQVMEIMVSKGRNTVVAHLKHLKEHNETAYLKEGARYLNEHQDRIGFDVASVMTEVHGAAGAGKSACGCPGSREKSFGPAPAAVDEPVSGRSQLRHWPVQMHLINPEAEHFRDADLLLAADCVAYSLGNFHQHHLRGRSLAIACPKLDSGTESYIAKIARLIDGARINTLTVMIMQVPCCGGLLRMVQEAQRRAERKVPVKLIIAGIEGNILKEEWI